MLVDRSTAPIDPDSRKGLRGRRIYRTDYELLTPQSFLLASYDALVSSTNWMPGSAYRLILGGYGAVGYITQQLRHSALV